MSDLFNEEIKQTKDNENKKIINLSKLAKYNMGIRPETIVTEDLLKKVCQGIMELTKTYWVQISVTKKDLEVLEPYINSANIALNVEGIQKVYDKDYLEFVKMVDDDYVHITLDQLNKFGDSQDVKNKNLILTINQDEFDKLSDEEILELYEKHNILECYLRMNDILNMDTERLDRLERPFNIMALYKMSKKSEFGAIYIEEIKDQIRAITNGINEKDSDLEKFMKVYTKLIENISYDYDCYNEGLLEKESSPESLSQEEMVTVYSNQNLTGLLTRNYNV